MARPPWCLYPSACEHVTGGTSPGQDVDDSGVACGGMLPSPRLHGPGVNTHRLCLRSSDGEPPQDYEVNGSDLWYLELIVGTLRDHARKEGS